VSAGRAETEEGQRRRKGAVCGRETPISRDINTSPGVRRRGGGGTCNARRGARRRCSPTVALISDIALVNIRRIETPLFLLDSTSYAHPCEEMSFLIH